MDRSIRRFGLGRAFASYRSRSWFLALGFGVASALSIAPAEATMCGGVTYPFPYTDVSGVGAPFCPGIMEAYVTGVTKGTTSTTFSPNDDVPRQQMTTFLQRSLDQGLARSNRRAALNRWWANPVGFGQFISLTGNALFCAADGEYIWTTTDAGHLAQVQASTGVNVNHWTGITNPGGVVAIGGQIFAVGSFLIGNLYLIDPTQPPGVATSVAALPAGSSGIAFDGTYVWTANTSGSVSKVLPITPYTVTTYTTGFTSPIGILYDGAHIWVTDPGAGKLFELDAMGNILGSGVTVGTNPQYPVFDGENIWVPNQGDNSITVVQASSGSIVATIVQDVQNNLHGPKQASFDGERVMVTNAANSSATVFKAADLSFIANQIFTDASPGGVCSDGINFWVEAIDLFRL